MSIIVGDCLEEMKKMEANSISCIVTDPPYGLSFMGKGWDHNVPTKEYWAECYRLTKPGAFLLAFGGTRTYHRLTCAIEDAGWEIRDCLSWLYGSGFPKSHNHFGIEGFGTALKPAWEPILMCMKPCEGTFAQNAEKWGQAGINIDGCRIRRDENDVSGWSISGSNESENRSMSGKNYDRNPKPDNHGRWPANLLLDEVAAEMLDEQSGITKSSGHIRHNTYPETPTFGGGLKPANLSGISDSGGASRFFYCAKASSAERNEGLEELALKEVRPLGFSNWEGQTNGSGNVMGKSSPQKNHHPTVKPLKLMEYLIKLVMPPKDGILLDPFAGSGTTILAAQNLGVKAIGIELSPEYAEIAEARLRKKKPEQLDLFELEKVS